MVLAYVSEPVLALLCLHTQTSLTPVPSLACEEELGGSSEERDEDKAGGWSARAEARC